MSAKKKKKKKTEFSAELVDVFETFTSNSGNKIDQFIESTDTNFASLAKIKVFDKGTKKVKKGYHEVKSTIANSLIVLKDYNEDVKVTTSKYIDVLDGLELPKYLDLNSYVEAHTSELVDLNKSDGKAVKVDGAITEADFIESTAVTADKLESIAKDDNTHEVELVDTLTDNKMHKLTSVEGGKLQGEILYNDAYTISDQMLEDISTYTEHNVAKLKEYYNTAKSNLKEVKTDDNVSSIAIADAKVLDNEKLYGMVNKVSKKKTKDDFEAVDISGLNGELYTLAEGTGTANAELHSIGKLDTSDSFIASDGTFKTLLTSAAKKGGSK